MVILICKIGLKIKPAKADKYSISLNSYEDILDFLSTKLSYDNDQYQLFSQEDKEIQVFIEKNRSKINCVRVIKTDELTDDFFEFCEKRFFEFLYDDYFKAKSFTEEMTSMVLICVNKTTPAFNRYVSYIWQEFGNYILPAGISFSRNTLYVAVQTDGNGILKFKKIKKEFLKLMDEKITPLPKKGKKK